MTDHLAAAEALLAHSGNPCDDMLGQGAKLERSAAVHALVDIAQSLRRLNEGRDQWYREVLEVLSAAKNPPASKGFGYYAEDPSEMCTARSRPDRRAWHRCLRMADHEGLHEDGMGNAFSKDYPKPEGSPVGSGQPAAASDGQEGGA